MVNVGGLLSGAAGGATVAIVIKAIDQFSGVFKNVNKGMLALGAGITAIGIAGAGAIIGVTRMAAAYETAHVTFETMLGSAEKATDILKDLSDFAAKTPFTIPGVREAAKQLTAYGFETKGLIDNMRMLGDVAGIFSISMSDMAYLYGTLRAQGRAYTRDMNQFANRGIPIWKEVAKVMGVAEDEIRGLVETGKVGFKEVEQAMINMTSEGGIAFEGMEKKAATLDGVISNIQDSFTKLGEVMGQEFIPAAKWVAENLAILMGWFEQHPTIAKWTAIILGLTTALALIAGPIIILIALLPPLAVGLGLVTGVMSPWLAIILAAIAAITMIILLIINWKDVLLALFKMMEFGAALWTIAWYAIQNVVLSVWNFIISIVEWGANKIVDMINWLIRQALKIPGAGMLFPGLKELESLDFGAAKGEIVDLSSKWTELMAGANTRVKAVEAALGLEEEVTEELEKQKGVVEAISKEQELVNKLQGFKVTRLTGDIFNPKSFRESEFQNRNAYEVAKAGGGLTINIENVNGLDPEEISKALSDELGNKVTL